MGQSNCKRILQWRRKKEIEDKNDKEKYVKKKGNKKNVIEEHEQENENEKRLGM